MLKPGYPYDPDNNCGRQIPPPPGLLGFVPTGTIWPQPGGSGTRVDITYGFMNFTSDLAVIVQKRIIEAALGRWAAVAPLHFLEKVDTGLPFDHAGAAVPDIRIGWFTGPAWFFDGPDGTLAWGFFPPPNGSSAAGDVHFDDDETWADGPGAGVIDLNQVATHEFGHSIGLTHETAVTALMNPIYTEDGAELLPDDIAGIQSLYGSGVGSVTFLPRPNKIRIVQGADREKGLEEALNDIVGTINLVVWKERAGYWVIWYSPPQPTPPPPTTTPPPVTTLPP